MCMVIYNYYTISFKLFKMEAKLKNVELIVGSSKKLPDIAIIMGIFFKVHKHCLEKLKCNDHTSEELCTGIEGACLGYALFENWWYAI